MADQTPEPVRHARAAADAVQELNRATIWNSGGLDQPADVYDTVRALADMTGRLPQTLEQLARVANSHRGLVDDRGPEWHPGAVLDVVTAQLVHSDAERLGRQLRTAAEHLSHLGTRDA